MAEGKIFLKENRDRIEKISGAGDGVTVRFLRRLIKSLRNAQKKWLWRANIYMRSCHTVISKLHLKYFWIMQRMAYIYGRKLLGGRATEEIFLNYVLFHRVNERRSHPAVHFSAGRSRELR